MGLFALTMTFITHVEIINSTRKAHSAMPLSEGNFIVASADKARISLKFVDLALVDLESARMLRKAKIYSLSIYHLQQAVEKASKAFGILLGVFRAESRILAKVISHRPLSGLVSDTSVALAAARALMEGFETDSDDVPKWIRAVLKRRLALQGLNSMALAKRLRMISILIWCGRRTGLTLRYRFPTLNYPTGAAFTTTRPECSSGVS